MKIITSIFLSIVLLGCSSKQQGKEITESSEQSEEPTYWYAFKPSSESNIVKLDNAKSEVIDEIELSDSVDTEYVFNHASTISQIENQQLNAFFENFKEFSKIVHSPQGYGPMVENTSYAVRVFVVCEENGLPIETENCTDNIYVLVQPTELGYESNLFKISRFFDTKIESLVDAKDGVILNLEHSRFPRKKIQILIRPELVKFI